MGTTYDARTSKPVRPSSAPTGRPKPHRHLQSRVSQMFLGHPTLPSCKQSSYQKTFEAEELGHCKKKQAAVEKTRPLSASKGYPDAHRHLASQINMHGTLPGQRDRWPGSTVSVYKDDFSGDDLTTENWLKYHNSDNLVANWHHARTN